MPRLGKRDVRALSRFPHDALFQALIRDERRAGALLRDHVPLLHRLKGRALRHSSVVLVDEDLKQSIADGVFEIGGPPGRPECIVIVEHKRTLDRVTFHQLNGYFTGAARRYAERGVFPAMAVFVVYTGVKRWNIPGARYWQADGWVHLKWERQTIEFILLDVQRTDYHRLSSVPEVRGVLGALGAARGEPAPEGRVRRIFRDLVDIPLDDTLWEMTCTYGQVEFGLELEEYWPLVPMEQRRRMSRDEMVSTIQQMLHEGKTQALAQGLAQGEAAGEARGRLEGVADVLLRLIRRRFGHVPDWAEDEIRTASIERVNEWAEAIFEAESVDELLRNGSMAGTESGRSNSRP